MGWNVYERDGFMLRTSVPLNEAELDIRFAKLKADYRRRQVSRQQPRDPALDSEDVTERFGGDVLRKVEAGN